MRTSSLSRWQTMGIFSHRPDVIKAERADNAVLAPVVALAMMPVASGYLRLKLIQLRPSAGDHA
jgi:hypothetical protein